jgi:hypothetical protein
MYEQNIHECLHMSYINHDYRQPISKQSQQKNNNLKHSAQQQEQQLEEGELMDTSPPKTSAISYPAGTTPAEPAEARYAGLLYHSGPPTLADTEPVNVQQPASYNSQLMYQLTPHHIPVWTGPRLLGRPTRVTWSSSQYKQTRFRPILPRRL